MAKRKSKYKVKLDLHRTLRRAMEEQGQSETDLATKTGVSLYAVRLVLAGSQRATLRAMVTVAFALGFQLDLHFYKPSLLEKLAEAASD